MFVWVHFPANTLPVFEHKMHLNPDSSFFLGKFNFPFPFENIHNRHPEAVWEKRELVNVSALVAAVAKPLIVGGHLDVPGRDAAWRVHFLSSPHPRDLHSRKPGSWHSVYVAQGAGDMWGVKWLTVKFLISAICSICCLNTPVASQYP